MQEFHNAGLTVAYEQRGSGPPILFIHNGGTSHTIWRHQIEAFSEDHLTVAIDLPGFGDSPLPSTAATFGNYVDSVAALITSLELAPLTIVGNCMGSNIAAAIAVEHPEWLSSLVLVNPLSEATFSAGGLGPLHKMKAWAPRTTGALRGISRRITLPSSAAKIGLRYQVGPKGVAAGVHHDPELIRCSRRSDQIPALLDVLDDMESYGALDGLFDADRSILPPICTIWGTRNRVLSAKSGQRLNAALSPQRSAELPGCGHLPMLEDPEAVTTIIRSFLSTEVAPRPQEGSPK